MTALGLLCVRLALAVVLVAHGAHKLFGVFAGPGIGPGGLDSTVAHFTALGLQPAFLLAVVAGLTQLAGGVLLAVGWFARWAALANLIYIGVGIWADHGRWGLFLNWIEAPGRGHGIEYSIVIAGALLCLILAGAGDASIDGRRANSRAARAAGRARLRGRA
jgi:putative oxidoreductase